jgi:2-polyprenyl-3-methyl-5-hydroxy-6-metoxy-1,4-benzoquinol methylase
LNVLLRRDYFLLPYRFLHTFSQRRSLVREVRNVRCISADRFRTLEENGPFQDVELDHLSETEQDLIRHVSFRNYFHVEWIGDRCKITDRHPETPFAQRQAMLATVYEQIPAEQRKNLSICDLGGSNGYYSFLAERYGFREVTVIEAREVHQSQFDLIKDKIAKGSKARFRLLDVAHGLSGSYDVVLAQGLLYHLYDHLSFLEALYRVTNKFLVLETALSGRFGFLNLTQLENVIEPRTGTQGISIYPSYTTVLALLRVAGFRKVSRILAPEHVTDREGYRSGYRVMFLAEK